jgi:hypothetical protein
MGDGGPDDRNIGADNRPGDRRFGMSGRHFHRVSCDHWMGHDRRVRNRHRVGGYDRDRVSGYDDDCIRLSGISSTGNHESLKQGRTRVH